MSFGLYCMLFGILVFFPETEAGELTWKEPLPIQTVPKDNITGHFSKKRLREGNTNATLRWHFALTGLGFDSLIIFFGKQAIAGARPSLQAPAPGFENQYDIYWVASQNLVTLFIFNVTTDVNGIFQCRVGAMEGVFTYQFSSFVEVDVDDPPSNIMTSSDQTITAPAELTLNCSADGKPKPTITWTRVSNNTVVYMPLAITGGKDEESYRCTADNDVGKPLSKVVNITILYKPDNVSLNIPSKVCAGTTVTFKCSASAANPSIQSYTLYKFVAGVTNSSSNQLGEFNETLLTKGLYNYTCEASNSVGNTSSQNRTIEVQVSGSIKIANSIIPVVEGASISVHCNYSGFHSQHVSWINASNYIVEAGNILKFHNISRHYGGEYNCSASNVCGGDSQRVFIDVQYPVEATFKKQYYSVLEGMSKTLTCPVAGNPEPSITWYNSIGAPVSSEKELEVGESGCYICIANNSIRTSINIIECLIVRRGTQIPGKLTIGADYMEGYKDLNSSSSIIFVAEFVWEMNRRCLHFPWYIGTEVTKLSRGSVIVEFIVFIKTAKTEENRLEKLKAAISANGTFGRYKAGDLVLLADEGTTSTSSGSRKPTVSAGSPWAIIAAVAGGVLLLAILVGVLTWWVHKQRKCRKDTKIHSDVGRHDNERGYSQVQGAYAQSGPPAANGTDGAAGQEIEVAAAAIPTYAVVDKSKKDKKQADEKPPEYAFVDKSKKEKQEAAAIPTYAAVDKSKKKKKKSCEEVPAVYAEVDKSKKKKKRTNDKNPYENFDETKKEKKPGELLYADLDDFQNPGMPTVCISPQPLPAIKKADPYERTDYADITQFLKGNATLPPHDGNGDTEMKPKRPSKRNVQGNDKETPI